MSVFKSGFVTVVGRPNVGKSTLINYLIGEKILIMSNKPQTTRNKIRAVYTLYLLIHRAFIKVKASLANLWLQKLAKRSKKWTY